MSVDYNIFKPIPISELFGERLKKYGMQDAQSPTSTNSARCLTDGEAGPDWAVERFKLDERAAAVLTPPEAI
jgi:hypothetical protein